MAQANKTRLLWLSLSSLGVYQLWLDRPWQVRVTAGVAYDGGKGSFMARFTAAFINSTFPSVALRENECKQVKQTKLKDGFKLEKI